MNSKMLKRSFLRLSILFIFILISESSEGEELESEECDCIDRLRSLGYIPKYAKCVEDTCIEVIYGNDDLIHCGDNTSFVQMLSAPTLIYDLTNRCPYVTIMQFVPEAEIPTYLRWLVHNVPTKALKEGFNNGGTVFDKMIGIDEGFVKAHYIFPSESTLNSEGYNTEIIFIYCQCNCIAEDEIFESNDRENFDVKAYVSEHDLTCPVVGFYHHSTFN